MADPIATASFANPAPAPGELIVLTIDHTDVDRATLTVAGTVTGSDGASGPWEATCVIDKGEVMWTETGGKVWTLQSATLNRSVFTTTA